MFLFNFDLFIVIKNLLLLLLLLLRE